MFNFAHLLGGKASRRLEEDDQDDPALEDDPQPQGKTRGRRVEDNPDEPDNDPDADDPDDPDDPDRQGRKAKKAKARARRADDNAGEDDDGDDRVDDPDDKQARMDERARCARIFGSPHAAGKPALAASLAFSTGMSSAAAIQVMANSGPQFPEAATPRRRDLDARMRQENIPKLKQESPKAGGLTALVSQYQTLCGKGK